VRGAFPLVVVVSFLVSCTGLTVSPEGRPCDDEQPCGPGTVCDPKTKTCVKEPSTDGAVQDAPLDQPVRDVPAGEGDLLGIDGAPDTTSPDTLQPDQFLVPDAGCPVGYTNCGSACADIATDTKHCGACNNACPADAADSCVAGKCVCGSTGAVCPAGLNCVQGACACVLGGRCNGCCNGPSCVPLGAGQSVSVCGQNGEVCKDCHDGNYCTEETCTAAGACVSTNRPDGTSCNDGTACSHSDACKAGVCAGTAYSCDDSLSCTSDTCTGDAPPNECTYTLPSYRCLINNVCYYNGENNPASPCTQVCSTSQSQTAWTAYSGPCVVTVAGDGTSGYVNGPALSARFNHPVSVLVDGTKVYIGEDGGDRIRLLEAGSVSLVAGLGVSGFLNGPVATAQFDDPWGMVSVGSGILVADQDNHRIRLIAGGQVSTAVGSGTEGLVDGAALSAQFSYPTGLAMDGSGNIYVGDRNNHSIRKIATDGTVTTLAGDGTAGLQDGAAAQARFNSPFHVAVDGSGNVYVADRGNHRIRKISAGQVSTIAGSGTTAGFLDGPAATSVLSNPVGVAVNGAGTVVYFTDANERVRTISAGTVSTLAGSGSTGLRDGMASNARFDSPAGLALDSSGNVYVADDDNHCIRLIKP